MQAAELGGDGARAMDAEEWICADLEGPKFGTAVEPEVPEGEATSEREGAGDPTSRCAEWIRLARVHQRSAYAYAHKNAMEMQCKGTSLGKVGVSSLAAF